MKSGFDEVMSCHIGVDWADSLLYRNADQRIRRL